MRIKRRWTFACGGSLRPGESTRSSIGSGRFWTMPPPRRRPLGRATSYAPGGAQPRHGEVQQQVGVSGSAVCDHHQLGIVIPCTGMLALGYRMFGLLLLLLCKAHYPGCGGGATRAQGYFVRLLGAGTVMPGRGGAHPAVHNLRPLSGPWQDMAGSSGGATLVGGTAPPRVGRPPPVRRACCSLRG